MLREWMRGEGGGQLNCCVIATSSDASSVSGYLPQPYPFPHWVLPETKFASVDLNWYCKMVVNETHRSLAVSRRLDGTVRGKEGLLWESEGWDAILEACSLPWSVHQTLHPHPLLPPHHGSWGLPSSHSLSSSCVSFLGLLHKALLLNTIIDSDCTSEAGSLEPNTHKQPLQAR